MKIENLKVVLLVNNLRMVTQIEEVTADLGEPQTAASTEPFVINDDGTLSPWLLDVTNDNTFMILSDKILTLCDPTGKIKDKYENLVKG